MYGIHASSSLAGQAVLVTGGASGIGRSVALLLADAGAHVTIGDLNEAGMAETVRLAAAAGAAHPMAALRCDVSDEADIAALVDKACEATGRIDGAANVAGYPPRQKLMQDIAWADWEKCVAINLGGPFFCMKHEIVRMLEAGGGAIVNVSSNTAIAGHTHMSDYTSAKAGVVGLVNVAVQEYGLKGIRVNTVLPGPVETPMLMRLMENAPEVEGEMTGGLPGRLAHPDEIGYAVRWLLSPEASYVNGACLTVDYGMTTG